MNEPYKICKNCRQKNGIDSLKCKACNAPMIGSMVIDFEIKDEDKRLLVCKNCNTVNKSDKTRCKSCNAPLQGSMIIDNKLMAVNERVNSYNDRSNKSTDEGQMSDFATVSKSESIKVCPGCSYPNMIIAKYCVKCNQSLELQSKNDNTTGVQNKNISMKATINPWLESNSRVKPAFKLHKLQVPDIQTNDCEVFEGDNVVLSRTNLDSTNETISGSAHAVVFRKNNRWYIKNESKYMTTYVRVAGEVELQEGDVILIGNTHYRFEMDPNNSNK